MTSTELQLRAREAEELAHRLLGFAGRVRTPATNSEPPKVNGPDGQRALSQAVASALALRRRRSENLDAALFGDPAWYMLLVLLEASLAHAAVTIKQVCGSSGSYEATARRWMAILIDQGLVELDEEVRDDDLKPVRLTEQGSTRMTRILLELE